MTLISGKENISMASEAVATVAEEKLNEQLKKFANSLVPTEEFIISGNKTVQKVSWGDYFSHGYNGL